MPPVLFDHIAIAVDRMAEASAFLVGELGGEPFQHRQAQPDGVSGLAEDHPAGRRFTVRISEA